MIYNSNMTDDITDGNSVLIVDDENMNMFALTHILRREYTVYAAKNGQSAIRIAKKQLPDVILLDILMPEMNGYEVLSQLKSDEETRKIPVIVVTGLINPEDEKKGLEMGAADYISKPFEAEDVRMKVQKQIEKL
jgi:PleD family two-component response regulator